MNKNKCQCHKAPCICGTGLCKNLTSAESALIENIDENGNSHYVESMYQKIPLKDFENIDCCVPKQTKIKIVQVEPADNDSVETSGDSNLNSTSKEETPEESIDCTDCCEHIYSTPMPDEKHDCKEECNITAELYCQIKRTNAEPGETFSDCSTSSSSEEDSDESDDIENIGDGSTEYVTAQGRTDDNSESTLDDEDFFSPNSVPHSTLIEGTEDRAHCQNKSCCPTSSSQKCNYIANEEKLLKNITLENTSINQTESERQQKPYDNDTIEVFNENTSNEVKWTTLHPKLSRHKNTRAHRPIPTGIEDAIGQTAKNERRESDGITNIKPSTSILNILQNIGQNVLDKTLWATLPEVQYRATKSNDEYTNINTDDTQWQTIVPENTDRFSGQSWKRQKVEIVEQPNPEDQQIENKRKLTKKVTMHKELMETISAEIQCIASNRKRKYGSIPNVFPDTSVRYDPNSDENFGRDDRRGSTVRRRRITLSNFVTEDHLKDDNLVPHDIDILNKPKHTDAYFLLNKSPASHDNSTRPWNTYVPCERSDFSIAAVDSFAKKPKQFANTENITKPTNNSRRDPRNSFIRQKIEPYRPSKFLCFKYIPKVSPKSSTTSTIENDALEHIAIDPPELFPPSLVNQNTKLLASRIPVSQSKNKLEKTPPSILTKSVPTRKTITGIDELRNVMVQKSNVQRRSIIPPENRKSFFRKKSVSRKSLNANDSIFESSASASASEQPSENEVQNKKDILQTNTSSNSKRVKIVEQNVGSDSSLRNKMKDYYYQNGTPRPFISTFAGNPTNLEQKQENKGETKTKLKVPLSAGATVNRSYRKNKNNLQKTCCSQTEIHVCIKESVSEKGKEESNILQMVNIDVTPKNSKLVKVNVMPTVPQVDKEGIITIPVQFKLCSDTCCKEMQKKSAVMYTSTPERQESSENNNYEQFVKEENENIPPENVSEESYVNLLWTKMKNTLSDSNKKETQIAEFDNAEIQTDLTLGQKLLSKSLSSLTSDESSSSVHNKSEPVKRSGIDWNDILLPPPGSFVIRKVPIKKSKRRSTGDSNKPKDNSMPSTSGGLPPTEEKKTRKVSSETVYPRNKLKCCGVLGKPHDEPYKPVNNKSSQEKVAKEDPPTSEIESKSTRSNVISLVFSESYYDPLHKTLPEEEKLVFPCTSKPEIPWTNILLPHKPQIRKMEKPDISKTSTSITDQTLTDEYNSTPPSPKNTDTCPNLSEDSSRNCGCDKNFSDVGTNTTAEEDCEATPSYSIKSPVTSNITTYSMDILKAFKEDPVLSAFKAFEEELKPVRKALAEVQSKLRALNIPELECIFKKDPMSEYAISRSSSQIGRDYGQTSTLYSSYCPSDTRRTPTCNRRPSYYNQSLSSCFGRGPSELFEHHRRPPHDDFRVYQFSTPPLSVPSRHLSTDMWKSFGSCERNTIKSPYEKFWKCQNLHNLRNADSYNYIPLPSDRYESNPESDLQFVSFDSSGVNRYIEKRNGSYFRKNMRDKRVKMINDDEDLDYPSTFRNSPASPNTLSQLECYCTSEHSIYSDGSEGVHSNHVVTNTPPKYISSFHAPSCKYSSRYIPAKVRPVTHYFLPDDDDQRRDLRNPKHCSTKNTSMNYKNGVVYARTKIELPKATNKRSNNIQKNVKNTYAQPNERNYYSQSEYDAFKCNRQHNDGSFGYAAVDDNLPNYSNRHKEYS